MKIIEEESVFKLKKGKDKDVQLAYEIIARRLSLENSSLR